MSPAAFDHSGADRLQAPLMQQMAEYLLCHIPTLSIAATFANEDGDLIIVTTEEKTVE